MSGDDEFDLDTADIAGEPPEHLYLVELYNCLTPRLEVIATSPEAAWEEFKRQSSVTSSKYRPTITLIE